MDVVGDVVAACARRVVLHLAEPVCRTRRHRPGLTGRAVMDHDLEPVSRVVLSDNQLVA